MFEKFKENLQKEIEKNGVKIPNIVYTKDGIEYTEDIILKRSNFPLIGDWSRVYPPVYEDENGNLKFHLINLIFGGKQNLIKLLVMLGIVAMVLLAFKEFFSQYEALKLACPQINNIMMSQKLG